MEDQQPNQKYKRYVGGGQTWLPIICGLAMAINTTTVDFSAKIVILNSLLGPVMGRSVYLLAGISLIAVGLVHALGFSREHKRIQTAEIAFAERIRKHRS